MPPESLSLDEARRLMLHAQGLAHAPVRPAEKADVLAAIRRMGALQIDTIHVVARSPYLVLWSRLGAYEQAWLDELLAEGRLFEYWAHAMCFLPIEDYPLSRRAMLVRADVQSKFAQWLAEHADLAAEVLERIGQEGGLRSTDFKSNNKPPGGWWNWKDEKHALEHLFYTGELMIARRQSFQRVYDLRGRVLPDWDDGRQAANVPTQEEVLRAHTLRGVQAMGVALADWVPDYFRLPKTGNLARLEALADDGLLQRAAIEGLPGPAYLDPAAQPAERLDLTTVLSPFDPLVWDRQRLKDLFGFEYTLEVYIPQAKRQFGYFTLPILHRGELVGRLDPKAHRKERVFEVKTLALETGVLPTDDLIADLRPMLYRLAAWHGTPELVIGRTEPASLGEALLAAA
ncbi:MAG: winged helix-turn-helix domain-containing protein [Anaerolineales bacterium]